MGSPTDASGRGNTLQVEDAAPTSNASGASDAAYALSSSLRSSLKVADGPDTDLTQAFTWAGCVRFGRIGQATETIAQKSNGESLANSMFQFDTYGFGANNRVRYRVMQADAEFGPYGAGPVLQNETWYHLAFVYDGTAGSLRYYLNGELQDTTEGVPPQLNNVPRPMEMGSNPVGLGSGNGYLTGAMDEVWWFARPLAGCEISTLAASCGEPNAQCGGDGSFSAAEREELVRLRRENRQLQMERELLKKWAAFFTKESSK
jgi:hypothetical protein